MPHPHETEHSICPPARRSSLIARIAYTAGGVPVEVNEMVLDSASYVLQYDFDS